MLPPQVSPPEFAAVSVDLGRISGVEVIAIPVFAGPSAVVIGPGADDLLELLDVDPFAALEYDGATGAVGELTAISISGITTNPALRAVVFVGVGSGSPDDVRRAASLVARHCRNRDSVATTLHLVGQDTALSLQALVTGMFLGSFVFHMRSEGPPFTPVRQVVLALTDVDRDPLAEALAIAGASWRARAMATVPSNVKTPAWFADQAAALAESAGLKVKVLEADALAAQGFGGLLAVGQAAVVPPRLVQLTYTPARRIRRKGHVALVGKGITFDSGGLSIKPGESMTNMKRDMTGGGAVLAVMAALADVACPVKVTGLICVAENAIGGNALRPGDVLTHVNGRTTEVTNTDAEGRLVLADGMAYAVAALKPDVLVDVATLTGAIRVALGQHLGGLFSNDEDLVTAFLAAGERSGERLWQMPLAPIYEDKLASKVADADNCPTTASALTAALFLQHFTGGLPWVHLDLASVGDAVADTEDQTPGPTGFGARVLLEWLRSVEIKSA